MTLSTPRSDDAKGRPLRSSESPADWETRLFTSDGHASWPDVRVAEFAHPPNAEDARLEASDRFKVVLVTQGEASIQSLTPFNRRAFYVPGRLGMTPAGRAPHLRWTSALPLGLRTIHAEFPQGLFAEPLGGDTAFSADELPDLLATNDPLLEACVRALDRAAREGADALYAESAARFMAVHILARHSTRRLQEPGPQASDFSAVIEYIRTDPGAPISLSDLATIAGLSVYHFSRAFRRAVGQTPWQYVLDSRLSAACAALRQTDESVAAVAVRAGFATPSHFTAAFRRRYGVTPSVFRREFRTTPAADPDAQGSAVASG